MKHSILSRAALATALVALSVLAVGCDRAEPARFRLNMLQMVDSEVPETHQQQIADILTAMYGTPDEPFVLPESGLDLKKLRMAAGPVGSDEVGNETGLFRRHCAHCHGVTGDGAGPTAAFLNPYPRDYRQGIFKFKSTDQAAKPTRKDLHRILAEGIPGTAMPSFKLLSSDQLDALVEYVVYLSMRGETEIELARAVFDLDEADDGSLVPFETTPEFLVEEILVPVAERWEEAPDQIVAPDPDSAPPENRSPQEIAASVAKGRELFYGKRANCFSCHGPSGLGDGQTNDYDYWNKAVKEFAESHEEVALSELGLLPVRNIRPRNLRLGVYRGGRQPLDLYRRIHAGINGAPMPGLGTTGALQPEEIWNLVDYVRSLPFEAASQPPKLPPALERERL